MENQFRSTIPPIAAPTGDLTHLRRPTDSQSELRSLAHWHRQMLGAMLFSILSEGVALFSYFDETAYFALVVPYFVFIAAVLMLTAAALRGVTVYQIAQRVNDPWAVVAAILTVWGLSGIVVTLIYNAKVRKRLREEGISIGWLGVSAKKLAVQAAS